MRKLKKESRKGIRKVEKMLRNLPVDPQTFTYVKMLQVLEELHFHHEYSNVCRICDALLK